MYDYEHHQAVNLGEGRCATSPALGALGALGAVGPPPQSLNTPHLSLCAHIYNQIKPPFPPPVSYLLSARLPTPLPLPLLDKFM